ncbi:Rpp14/Pop5 family protein [uncultured Methanoregula sp.]|uniref:Rpp14/Pop5 family protein n=1 Tax=uncultured Methanoregula sp. TaxID=1005933 RepID=UPI002AAACCA9|nr:Rpp14/Pop5 family protein [uncultured Methanoregula sp.]
MTVRPPTLRENRRYILARVLPAGTPIDQKELYFAISDAVTSLCGDSVAAVITPAVVAAEGDFVFIRCRRGTERELSIALSTVTGCRETKLALRILAISGTMESLRERIRMMSPTPVVSAEQPALEPTTEPPCETPASPESIQEIQAPLREYEIGGITYTACHCDGQKVDVIEKGFKNTNRLFLTKEDLEKL